MLNKNSALGRRPLWILTSYQHNQMNPLTLDPDGDGGFLPVFSFEEEAQAFLQLLGDEGKGAGWRIRETTAGELISVLLALCAQVKGVALDPVPLPCGTAVLPFISVKRNHFMQDLLDEGRRMTGELLPVKGASPTPIHLASGKGSSRKPAVPKVATYRILTQPETRANTEHYVVDAPTNSLK
jgi:hypothetical protein